MCLGAGNSLIMGESLDNDVQVVMFSLSSSVSPQVSFSLSTTLKFYLHGCKQSL